MLAPSTFLLSTLQLQESILPYTSRELEEKPITENEIRLLALSIIPKPVAKLRRIQKVCDGLILSNFDNKNFPQSVIGS